jgi:protein-disulfide isomerase
MAAPKCVAPDSTKSAEIVSYLMKRYQIASSNSLVLTNSSQATGSCFWKLEYTATAPKQTYTLYLSPDQKYLSPILYDISLDPLSETKQKDAEMLKVLLTDSNPGLGPSKAPVTIVEFSDFQCPYCKRMTDVLEKEVLPKEGKKVNVVFRNFPLPMHPWAKQAAEIAECAALQRPAAFWAFHDFFFQNQQAITLDTIKTKAAAFAASRSDLDQSQFSVCVERELSLGPVAQDQQLGERLGIRGTPSLFVNGVRFDGLRTADEMIRAIEQAERGELVSAPAAGGSGVTSQPTVGAQLATAGSRPAVDCSIPPSRGGTANAR